MDDQHPRKENINKRQPRPESRSSVYGARGFYFVTYGLFYVTLLLYKNQMRDILTFSREQEEGSLIADLLYVLYYFGTHGLAIYYFMTAGDDPGFVDATETESEKQLRK